MSYLLKQISLVSFAFLVTHFVATCVAQKQELMEPSQPILEISFRSFDAYSSWCKEPLHTRLYADGRLDSESCELSGVGPDRKPVSTHRYVPATKHHRSTSEQLAELIRLAQERDFVNAKPGYSGGSMADAVIDITILYRGEKGVKVIKLWNVVPSDTNQNLPPSLNRIFKKLEEIEKGQ